MSWDRTFDHPAETEAEVQSARRAPPTAADLRRMYAEFKDCVYEEGDVVVARPEYPDASSRGLMLVIGVKRHYEKGEYGIERARHDLLVITWSDDDPSESPQFVGMPVYSHTIMHYTGE